MTESNANLLCKACGLCCSGHLFSWVRLNAPELDKVEKLGLNVIRDDPRQRGFLQPCPMWSGVCSVYTSPDYPRSCNSYKCKTLRQLLENDISYPDALSVIEKTLGLIKEIELLLLESPIISFRERIVTYKEELEEKTLMNSTERDFLQKADVLINRFEDYFGVFDFIDYEK